MSARNMDNYINELEYDLAELKEQRIAHYNHSNHLMAVKEQQVANHYINQVMNMHNNLIENMKIDQKYANFEKVCEVYNMSNKKCISQETKKQVLDYIQNNGITDMSYTMQLLYKVENGNIKRIQYVLQKD